MNICIKYSNRNFLSHLFSIILRSQCLPLNRVNTQLIRSSLDEALYPFLCASVRLLVLNFNGHSAFNLNLL